MADLLTQTLGTTPTPVAPLIRLADQFGLFASSASEGFPDVDRLVSKLRREAAGGNLAPTYERLERLTPRLDALSEVGELDCERHARVGFIGPDAERCVRLSGGTSSVRATQRVQLQAQGIFDILESYDPEFSFLDDVPAGSSAAAIPGAGEPSIGPIATRRPAALALPSPGSGSLLPLAVLAIALLWSL